MVAVGVDHDDQDLRVLVHGPKRLVQLLGKRYGKCVPGFGPIQGDHSDSAQFFVMIGSASMAPSYAGSREIFFCSMMPEGRA
jgi:hypothetical protein